MKQYTLSGNWKLAIEKEKTAQIPVFTDTMTLPGTISEQQKSEKNEEKNTGYLTDPYAFEGAIWLKRHITLTEYDETDQYTLIFERSRKTSLWIDGAFVGEQNSFCTAHRYDITPYAAPEMELIVCVENTGYLTKGGHMTSPDTQTNWIGILGELKILQENPVKIEKLRLLPNAQKKKLQISFVLTEQKTDKTFTAQKSDKTFNTQKTDKTLTAPKQIKATLSACGVKKECLLSVGTCTQELFLPDAELWSEWTPNIHEFSLELENGNRYSKPFGFRTIAPTRHEDGSYCLTINGRDTLLRGKHDGMIFPMTGYAPMDVDSWKKVMGTAKSYGINHYRFHTCCPPEAAFDAADQLGIYMEPELPFWGSIAAKGEEGYNETEQNFLIEEGFRILADYGHHPSFMMLSMGNELWGNPRRVGEIVAGFKKEYPEFLYTAGSNNFQFTPTEIPEEDVYVGVRLDRDSLLRGSYAMCDAPQGFVQTDVPNTLHTYDLFFEKNTDSAQVEKEQDIEIQYETGVKKVKVQTTEGRYMPQKPVITHEVGQYFTYPDLKEIEQYTGVLKAENFAIFKERLAQAGLLELAEQYTACSGALAAACYKSDIEAARRSRHIAGYQLLDLQDFNGQGTATVGILNAFMEPKGIISREDWNAFNAQTVALAGVSKFVWTVGEQLTVSCMVSHFGKEDLKHCMLQVSFGTQVKQIPCPLLGAGLTELGTLTFEMEEAKKEILTLILSDETGEILSQNHYDFYIYREKTGYEEALQTLSEGKDVKLDSLLITASRKTAQAHCETGGTAVVFAKAEQAIEGTYATDFWNYPMFRSISESMNRKVPVGTLGLLIDKDHPILADFYSESYTTPQWYQLLMNGNAEILDGTGIFPIVRVMDNVERNHSLGFLYETTTANNGRMIVCTIDAAILPQYPETRQLFSGIITYARSHFVPGTNCDRERTGTRSHSVPGTNCDREYTP